MFGGRAYPSNTDLYWLGLVQISNVQLVILLASSLDTNSRLSLGWKALLVTQVRSKTAIALGTGA